MGIFSFLTGKSDGPATADGPASEATAVAAPSPESIAEPTAAAAPAETPFAAPAAWDIDTGALTAPVVTPSTDAPTVGPADTALTAELQGPIIEVIKTVYDPEIPVDIYELGLIYEIIVDAERRALVKMTLTSPACPSAQQLPSEVRYKVKAVPGVSDAAVEIVWEPPWDKDRMSEAAKLQLGFF
jgi:FeS assembly SUF system protein